MNPSVATPGNGHSRALKILAKSVFKELRQNGYTQTEIVAFTNVLLGLVTDEIKHHYSASSPA